MCVRLCMCAIYYIFQVHKDYQNMYVSKLIKYVLFTERSAQINNGRQTPLDLPNAHWNLETYLPQVRLKQEGDLLQALYKWELITTSWTHDVRSPTTITTKRWVDMEQDIWTRCPKTTPMQWWDDLRTDIWARCPTTTPMQWRVDLRTYTWARCPTTMRMECWADHRTNIWP